MESKKWHTPLQRIPKYYVRNEVLNIEEDQTHEFKGHRNISVHDIPPWCINLEENNRTRNAVSRYWYEEITLFWVLIRFIWYIYLEKNFYFWILTTVVIYDYKSYNLCLNPIVSLLFIGICVVSWTQDWVALCMLEYRMMAQLLVCDLQNTNRITCCSVCRMLWMLSNHLFQVSCTVPSLYLSSSQDMITQMNCELIFTNYWSEVLTVVNVQNRHSRFLPKSAPTYWVTWHRIWEGLTFMLLLIL